LKKKLFVLIFFLFFGIIYSQTLEGKILNATTLQPVENSSISNLASEIIVVSNRKGEFRIITDTFPVNIEISADGYISQLVKLNNFDQKTEIYLIPTSEVLSEVIIRSTIIPAKLQKIPASVSLISSEDLKRIDASNLALGFNNVPGVYVNQGALNTTKLNIRGIGARSQYSTNRIQAYFNGIPLTTAEGELTLDDIDSESLSGIEVIKGPTSSLYGAGLGGVINLFSAEADIDKTEVSVNSLFGSFGMHKQTVSASHGTSATSLFANYSELQSDGYRDNGEYNRKSALIHASLKSEKGNTLSFLANLTKLKAFIPSSLNAEDFIEKPSSAASNWEESKGFESYDRGLLGVSYQHNFSSHFSNTSTIYLNFRNAYEPRPFDILKEDQVAAGARTKFNLETAYFQLPSKISFGAQFHREWYTSGTFENLYKDFENRGSVLGESLSNNEQDRNYANFFGQVNLEISEKINIETGFNLNSTRYRLTDLFVQDETDQSGNYRFKTIFSPRLGITYEVINGKSFYSTISHGFSTPTVAETLTPEGQINTNLKPETGINYEVGFKGNWLENTLFTEVALYSIQIDNLLVAQRIAEDQYVGINAGKTNHNGIEIFTSYRFNLFSKILLKPYANAALNFFEFEEFLNRDLDFSGNKLPGVPRSTINLGLDIKFDNNLSFYTNLLAVGKIPLNDANSIFTDNYKVLNLKASYDWKLFKDFEIQFSGGLNNVFDEKYAASVLPNAVGFGGTAPRYYYPGNPRNYFGEIGLNYVF